MEAISPIITFLTITNYNHDLLSGKIPRFSLSLFFLFVLLNNLYYWITQVGCLSG